MKHSELPWRINIKNKRVISSSHGDLAGCLIDMRCKDESYKDNSKAKANAEFIVKAANNHYDLIDSLRGVDQMLIWGEDFGLKTSQISEIRKFILTSLKQAEAAK